MFEKIAQQAFYEELDKIAMDPLKVTGAVAKKLMQRPLQFGNKIKNVGDVAQRFATAAEVGGQYAAGNRPAVLNFIKDLKAGKING